MNCSRCTRIDHAVAVRAAVLFAQVMALVVGAVLPCANAAAAPPCPAMVVGEGELDGVLDQTLGTLREFIDQRSVSIDPGSDACYLRIRLATAALPQFGAACRLEGCSTILHRPKSIALRDFDITGCDALFNGLGLSRHVPSTYVDASARIRQQCGSDDYAIDRVTAVRVAGAPKLRFEFRQEPARQ
jgi:hypothetical protein